MIELHAGPARASVDEASGGRVASLSTGAFELLAGSPADGPIGWGAYPMVPWAGRVREGRFSFEGVAYELERADGSRHAMHGTGYRSAWTVSRATREEVDLEVALDWPLGGTANQRLRLFPDRLECSLSARAADRAMPAVVGWHPWFSRPLDAELRFARMYERGPDHLPTGRLVAPRAGPRDDCFVDPRPPLRLRYDVVVVTISSDCDHWVVYDEPRDALCVEPQSAPPDAFNLGNAARLEPGEELRRTMVVSWAPRVTGG